MKTPQETERRAASRAKSGKERASPGSQMAHLAHGEGAREESVPTRNQEEKGATANSDFRCLRSGRPAPSLDRTESEQRVARGAKRCAEDLQKEKDSGHQENKQQKSPGQ